MKYSLRNKIKAAAVASSLLCAAAFAPQRMPPATTR